MIDIDKLIEQCDHYELMQSWCTAEEFTRAWRLIIRPALLCLNEQVILHKLEAGKYKSEMEYWRDRPYEPFLCQFVHRYPGKPCRNRATYRIQKSQYGINHCYLCESCLADDKELTAKLFPDETYGGVYTYPGGEEVK